MAARLWIVAVAVWLLLAPSAALADKRVALLIGNSNYAAAGRLANPAGDVALMKAAFDGAGFDTVETAFDLTRDAMVRRLRAFEDQTADADIAVIYYSGHGMELGGENFLVPVDAVLKADRDVADETVPLDRAMRALDGANRLKLVILDACRDNPFLAKMQAASGKTKSLQLERGLARVEPASANTLVAFAAKGGTVALDGDGANSPFATALARRLVEPGAEVEFALRQVRDDVLKATANRQEPFKYGSLGGDPIMLSKLPVQAAAPVTAAPAPPPIAGTSCADAGAHWAQAEKFDKIEFYQAHLKFFGDCAYAEFAKARIAALEQQAAAKTEPVQPQPAPPPVEEQHAAIKPALLPTTDAASFDPTPLLPVSVAEADRTRFLEFDATRSRSITAALATKTEDAAALRQIVAGDPQPIRDADLLGKWRCRSAQIDDGVRAGTSAGVFTYPYFRCAITRQGQGQGLFLAKVNGSQRVSGRLYRVKDDRFVFLGGDTVNDDPQLDYGAKADSNVVAYLFKVGPGRLRLEMPQTCCSSLEILEFVR
jgi:uncharacterized caspase-like protein